MTEQRVKGKPIGSLAGMLLVLAIALAMIVANALSRLLSAYMPAIIPMAATWLLAAACVFLLMRGHIVEYNYTVSGGQLYVERVYGVRSKLLLNVPLSDILALDSESALRSRWPDLGRALRATLKSCAIPVRAIAYRKQNQRHIALIQPDERIASLLWDDAARAAAQRDKWG